MAPTKISYANPLARLGAFNAGEHERRCANVISPTRGERFSTLHRTQKLAQQPTRLVDKRFRW
jgi:hypothetical protein